MQAKQNPRNFPSNIVITFFLFVTCLTKFASCEFISKEPHDFLSEYDDKKSENGADYISTDPGKCGGVIKLASTNTVRVNYKPFEKISPNERCVWIIVAANSANVSTSYTVRASKLGFDASDRLLMYSGLEKRTELLSQSYPSGEGSSVQITGRVLLVTFHSRQNTTGQNGFILTVVPDLMGPGVNVSSRYEILNPDTFYHKHPTASGNYGDYELTALVLPPVGPYDGGFRKQIVRCKKIKLESYPYDRIGVHIFDAQTVSWKYKGYLTGGFDVEKIIHEDIILIVFDSDGSNVFEGFELYSITV